MQLVKPSRLPAFAASECFLILPAALLLAAAAVHSLQPIQYEPARTSSLILEWITPHLSRAGAALLFIGLPALVAVLGGVAIREAWTRDADLRDDFARTLAVLFKHLTIVVLLTATVLAGSILGFALSHFLTD